MTKEQKALVEAKQKQFKEELQALLKKYDAHLGASWEGDGQGIYNEGVDAYFVHRDIKTANGNSILSDVELDRSCLDFQK